MTLENQIRARQTLELSSFRKISTARGITLSLDTPRDWFVVDSALEGGGFEIPVPPEGCIFPDGDTGTR
jgi:hypothetical protein